MCMARTLRRWRAPVTRTYHAYVSLRIGILGARRTRNGLGPFLAQHLEAAGARVAAVGGRDAASAGSAAAALATLLGHEVGAHGSVHELCRSGIDALVIASPPGTHADALEVALAARLPTLCEKPLVEPRETDRGLALVDGFDRAGVLLVENCQWPFVLPALFTLHPQLTGATPNVLRMRLSPSQPGPGMVSDSLSHLLSLAQSLVAVGGDTEARDVALAPFGADGLLLRLILASGVSRLHCALELVPCPAQPRPAWIEVDGCRMEREIGPGYAIQFRAEDRVVSAPDPMRELVYRFASLAQHPVDEPRRAESRRIRERARLFGHVVRCCEG